jgi:hypothetical protein
VWDAVVQSVEASTYDAVWLYSHRHGAPDDDYVEPNIWGASEMQVGNSDDIHGISGSGNNSRNEMQVVTNNIIRDAGCN